MAKGKRTGAKKPVAKKPAAKTAKAAAVDWDALLVLAQTAYGHAERKAKPPPAPQLAAARAELSNALVAIAKRYAKRVTADDDNDAMYLIVAAQLDTGVELRFCVGGEGYAWVEASDAGFMVVDCMGFDDMAWDYVERTIGPPRYAS